MRKFIVHRVQLIKQAKFLMRIKKNFYNKYQKYSFNEIKNYLLKVKKLKTLVIGETIIDEYVYCNPLGKSGKEPYLAFKELYGELYLGGASAISRQIKQFGGKIDMISMIGEKNDYFSFIKKFTKGYKISFLKKIFTNNTQKKIYRSNFRT